MVKQTIAECEWLLAEWHPTKNKELDPGQISVRSRMVVWWYLPYKDMKTGKIHHFEWQAEIRGRFCQHSKCPYLTGNAVWTGFNDLQTLYPKVASEWHPTKNGNLTPDKIRPYSKLVVWWFFPYDDPKSGKHFNFEWKEKVSSRTTKNLGCPYLTNRRLWTGYNDLATLYPELAAEWNVEKNGMEASEVTGASTKTYWWIRYYEDEFTGKNFQFEWQASINARAKGKKKCPYLNGRAVYTGFNDLATRFPDIAAEWHPKKNGDLTPDRVYAKDDRTVWWYKRYWDPVLNKTFEFEWEMRIYSRTVIGCGCPYLSGHALYAGFNDLATRFPTIACDWDYEKNGDLTPDQVMPGSKKVVHWKIFYNDPITNIKRSIEWEASVNRRTSGQGCPYLTNGRILEGFNDLATTHPQLAAQWDPVKNGNLKPTQVTYGSKKRVWWYLDHYDEELKKEFRFEWQVSVNTRTNGNTECPFLINKAVWPGFNDLKTRYPDIAKEWNYKKNGQLKPDEVIATSRRVVWWNRDYEDPETGVIHHMEWKSAICTRTRLNVECPYLAGCAVWTGFNDLQTCFPDIAVQWADRNRFGRPDRIYKFSKTKVWWHCPECGNEWKTAVSSRTVAGTGCPVCAKNKRNMPYN